MSVYTIVERDNLVQLLKGYALGKVVALDGIQAGVVNSNYHLFTESGRWLLTLVEDPDHGRALPWIIRLLVHFHDRGIPAPVPIMDRHGDVIQRLHDRPALLVTFLDGASPERPSAFQCHEAGKWLARLHLAGRDFGEPRDNPMGLASWRWLLEQNRLFLPMAVARTLADELERAAQVLKEGDKLPAGVCHADYFPDNVLFHPGHHSLTGILDFHYACRDLLAYDLAIALTAWCFDRNGDLNPERYAAFLQGYQSVRLLDEGERAMLHPLMRVACLRFILTRLHASHYPRAGSAVTRKPPEEYLERLRTLRKGE